MLHEKQHWPYLHFFIFEKPQAPKITMIYNTRVEHFCAIIEAGSIHKAATLLHLTAGSISRSVQKLKEEVGFDLFYLEGRKLVLTRQGLDFYRLCKQSIDDSHQKIRDIQTYRPSDQKELRLGTFELFSTHFLADLLDDEALFEFNPVVHEVTPGQIENALIQNEIDFGITTVPVITDGIEYLPIKKIEIGVYAKPQVFDHYKLADLPFATPRSDLSRNTLNLNSLDGWDPTTPRRIRYRFEMLETALLAARRGHCAVYIPRYLGERPEFNLVALTHIEKQIRSRTMQVYLVKRKADPTNSLEKKLARAIRIVLG